MTYQPSAVHAGVWRFLDVAASDAGYKALAPHYNITLSGFRYTRDAFKKAHVFHFAFNEWDSGESDDALVEFTYDCIVNGLYNPPFDSVFMSWPDTPPKSAGDVQQDASALIITFYRRGTPTEFAMADVSQAFADRVKEIEKQEMTVTMVYGFVRAREGAQKGYSMLQDASVIRSYATNVKLSAKPYAIFDVRHMMAYDIRPGHTEAAVSDAGVTIRATSYFLAAMASRNSVTYERQEPKPSIAARRSREGKAPWVSHSIVRLNMGSAKDEHAALAARGERASPRLHWRRGHIRRWGERIIAVPPTLVGASELGQVISEYRASKARGS